MVSGHGKSLGLLASKTVFSPVSLDRLIRAYEMAEKILKGSGLKSLKAGWLVSWDSDVRARFVEWMKANGRSLSYIERCVLYLNKYVSELSKPGDVVELFEKCRRGRNHLDRALRNLLKYYQLVEGYPEDFIDRLRKAIPRIKTGVDYREPVEDEIVKTFKALRRYPLKYRCIYHLILDGGIRVSHARYLVNNFRQENLKKVGEFYRYTLGLERGTKHSFYAYMREETAMILRSLGEKGVKVRKAAMDSFLKRHRSLVKPKYVRKFAYNMMILSGIPETIADFINGRKPRTVGGQHYMFLRTQADQHYHKYVKYLEELTKKFN